jgi:hypothetical protein
LHPPNVTHSSKSSIFFPIFYSAQVGFLLQRATPSNRSQILKDGADALNKVRALVRAQFTVIPSRDVLRYNKSIGWSHQEFVEAWGLWHYLLGSRAPTFKEFDEWLNDADDMQKAQNVEFKSPAMVSSESHMAGARMYVVPSLLYDTLTPFSVTSLCVISSSVCSMLAAKSIPIRPPIHPSSLCLTRVVHAGDANVRRFGGNAVAGS